VLAPKQDDRGARTDALCARSKAEEAAEESRVFYVAATRARDRLILAGPVVKPKGLAEWAGRGLNDDFTKTKAVPTVLVPEGAPEPALQWLGLVQGDGVAPPLVGAIRVRRLKPQRSATELMTYCRSPAEWRQRYEYGVLPSWDWVGGDSVIASDSAVIASGSAADGVIASGEAARQSEVIASEAKQSRLSPRLRGQLIHSVLERIRDEEELAELLDVVVGTLDAPELEEVLAPGSRVREQLEAEIRGVVASPEWQWYVEGPHWRELRFVDIRSPVRWHVGAFDLYRQGEPGLIVDFKTQDVTVEAAKTAAEKYRVQARLYEAVAGRLAGSVQTRFHFTKAGAVIEA
jgi:ATP-dependent exoDNAse (exonuclease V) beta subunit